MFILPTTCSLLSLLNQEIYCSHQFIMFYSGRRAVHLSTRSGAWIIPNYVFGSPTDLYASRFLLHYLPFKLRQFVLEVIVRLIYGSPYKYGIIYWKIVKQHQCNANDIYGRVFLLSLVQKLLCILHGQNSWLHNVFVYICRLVNNQHKCRDSCANLKALELSTLVSSMQPNMLYPRDVDNNII